MHGKLLGRSRSCRAKLDGALSGAVGALASRQQGPPDSQCAWVSNTDAKTTFAVFLSVQAGYYSLADRAGMQKHSRDNCIMSCIEPHLLRKAKGCTCRCLETCLRPADGTRRELLCSLQIPRMEHRQISERKVSTRWRVVVYKVLRRETLAFFWRSFAE